MLYPKRNINYRRRLHRHNTINRNLLSHRNYKIIDNKTIHNKTNYTYCPNSRQLHFYISLFILTIIIVSITLNRLELNIVLKQVRAEGIDYDSFREMLIPVKMIKNIKNELNKEEIKNSEIAKDRSQQTYNTTDYITLAMLLNSYNLNNSRSIRKRNRNYLIDNLSHNKSFMELKEYYKAILGDIKCFPVVPNSDGKFNISFTDTWNNYRSYGGNRRHEGTDLMSGENIRGVYPVISMTDGTVEKMGWLEQGGYRVGIRGTYGAYYYYAHLDSYAQDIKIGNSIKAGKFLGYMGDSGYGTEGTIGKFDVHLHVGIYVETDFGELSVNPYWILRYLEAL
ncbi:MAG: M23 family metallopeptidase [Anaerocolumna sp.]